MLFLEEEVLLWVSGWFADEGYCSEETEDEWTSEEEDGEEYISGESSDEEEYVMVILELAEAREWREFAGGLELYFEEEEWLKLRDNFFEGFEFFFLKDRSMIYIVFSFLSHESEITGSG